MLDESIPQGLSNRRAANGLAADPAGLAALRRDAAQNGVSGARVDKRMATIEAAAQEFEALLIGQMLKTMRSAQQTSGLFDSQATETYQSLLDEESARNFAAQGGLGLRDMMVRQLLGEGGTSAPVSSESGRSGGPSPRMLPESTGTSLSSGMTASLSGRTSAVSTGSEFWGQWSGMVLDARYGARFAGQDSGLSSASAGSPAVRGGLSPEDVGSSRELRLPERRADLRSLTRLAVEIRADQNDPSQTVGANPLKSVGEEVRTSTATRRGTIAWPPSGPDEFVTSLRPYAERAAAALGVDAATLLAQSALETGWGQRLPSGGGRSSFNLFGIKAHGGWNGAAVTNGTFEVRDGVVQRETARFRAYASPEHSFRDYVDFLRTNPRYRDALKAGDGERFIRGIHHAGYATDPAYADKVLSIRDRVQQLLAESTEPGFPGLGQGRRS
ncbi:MAG: glucosaminidase domain-containing protein [Thioalkalivibrionaceae bacterium]